MHVNKAEAIIRLTRIEHSAMLAVAVVVAEIIARALPGALVLALSMITPIFVSMGAFALNDYFDVSADTINRMRRPLVVGALNRSEALAVGVGALLIGIAASLFINTLALLVALVFAFIAVLYSYRLKDMPLAGNVLIALSMAIPFIYGDFVVVGALQPSIVMIVLVVFLSGLAREIHGMIRDYAGDVKARHTRNVVRQFGVKKASYAALTLYMEAIIISVYMFFSTAPFAYNAVYLVPILAVDAVLLYVAFGYTGRPSRRFFDNARNISLGAMAASILIFLAAALFIIRI
jgi:4-hydroxybenzoate polyprenyltransferase